ncbi:unnamed protein product [marine sediment metagenome]|uniref:Uncharacterized protein n=1 Tax=marine sediment metagenome TaxID=412755 RepID=X1E072_9ZZZZ
MSNGVDVPDKSNKMAAIHEKLNHLTDSCKKNLSLAKAPVEKKPEEEKVKFQADKLPVRLDRLQLFA